MSKQKLTLREVKLRKTVLSDQQESAVSKYYKKSILSKHYKKSIVSKYYKESIVSKYNDVMALAKRWYPYLVQLRNDATNKIVKLNNRIIISDFKMVKNYFCIRTYRRSFYNKDVNKISKKPPIKALMEMFSIDIMSNYKYEKPSDWFKAKYDGSEVKIELNGKEVNPTSLSSEINGIEPRGLATSLYSVCTNGKNDYNLVMKYLECADRIPDLVKEAEGLYRIQQLEVDALPGLLTKAADFISKKCGDIIDKT